MPSSRLIVVSNRLPITITRTDEGGWQYSMSSGGLVSALSGLKKDTSFTWLGWCNASTLPFPTLEMLEF
jgi:trehalose 6-phosphate synthase